jgi:hypothetical protein
MSDPRRIGRCETCERPIYDTDEYATDDAGNRYCPWCAPDLDPTPTEATDDR